MAVMRIDHPDIVEFINAKQDGAQLTNFNLSVAITDEFMSPLRETPERNTSFTTHAIVRPRRLPNRTEAIGLSGRCSA